MPYFLMIGGLLVMCVPEQASFWQLATQGAFGLALFITGVIKALEQK